MGQSIHKYRYQRKVGGSKESRRGDSESRA